MLKFPINKKKVISTGVPSLDKSLEHGGLQEGEIHMFIGDATSRKDLFGYRFLTDGLEKGERVAFYDIESSSDEILELLSSKRKDWDPTNLQFMDACPEYSKFYINAVPGKIIDDMKNLIGVSRVLINPLTFFVEKFGIDDAGDFLIRIREIAMKKDLTVLFLMANILDQAKLQSIIDKCDGVAEMETKVVMREVYHQIKLTKFGSPLNLLMTYVIRENDIQVTKWEKVV